MENQIEILRRNPNGPITKIKYDGRVFYRKFFPVQYWFSPDLPGLKIFQIGYSLKY